MYFFGFSSPGLGATFRARGSEICRPCEAGEGGPVGQQGGIRSPGRGVGSHRGVSRTTGVRSAPTELLPTAPEPLGDSAGFLLPHMGGGGPPPPPPSTGFLLPHMGGGGPPPPPLSAGFLLPHMGGGGPLPPPDPPPGGFWFDHIGGGGLSAAVSVLGPLPPPDPPPGGFWFDHIGGGGLPASVSVLGSPCMGDSALPLPSLCSASRAAAGEPDPLVGRLPPLANNLEPNAFMV